MDVNIYSYWRCFFDIKKYLNENICFVVSMINYIKYFNKDNHLNYFQGKATLYACIN